MEWRPTANLSALQRRAELLARVRRFFAERGVLEVETPSLAQRTVTDPAIDSLDVDLGGTTWYLQTSPEFHMKRLLAAGAPAIVRIGSAFRADEQGRLHNPEFTMIEWYRPGFAIEALQEEVAHLVDLALGPAAYSTLTYRELISSAFSIDVARTDARACRAALEAEGAAAPSSELAGDVRALCDYLFVLALHKRRGRTFVTEFPAEQAALAETRVSEGVEVADRFELVIDGLEIANGYAELTDAAVLEARMRRDNERRRAEGRRAPTPDERLLAAMRAGLPQTCGVALGFDRLVMLAAGATSLEDVIAFPASRA